MLKDGTRDLFDKSSRPARSCKRHPEPIALAGYCKAPRERLQTRFQAIALALPRFVERTFAMLTIVCGH
jgi:hypothetical protein